MYQSFSVAISVYKNDNPVFFDRALESITDKQTIKPDEVVLVVDGPVSDETNEVIDKYASKYNFNVIRLEKNGGLGNALKIATENCKNNLIARMDSDDVAIDNRFEQQLNFLNENPSVDIVGGNISEFVDLESNVISFRNVPSKDIELKKFTKKRCPFNHMTVMYKKESIFKAGGYIDWHYNEDYFLWIRMAMKGAVFANTGTLLVNVRTGIDQISRRGGRKYFESECKLQGFMLKNNYISLFRYLINVTERLIVQLLMPKKLRVLFYKKIVRKNSV